jgi:hypothetical protein
VENRDALAGCPFAPAGTAAGVTGRAGDPASPVEAAGGGRRLPRLLEQAAKVKSGLTARGIRNLALAGEIRVLTLVPGPAGPDRGSGAAGPGPRRRPGLALQQNSSVASLLCHVSFCAFVVSSETVHVIIGMVAGILLSIPNYVDRI